MRFGLLFLLGLIACGKSKNVTTEAPTQLDLLHSDGTYWRDPANRIVTLRGYVLILNYADGTQVTYTDDDFARMKALGMNYVSIRVGMAGLGCWPGTAAESSYLDRIDALVTKAKAAGMHVNFKLTIYDVSGGSNQANWDVIWNNTNSAQQSIQSCWTKLWQKYTGENAVVAFDLLNEPQAGSNNVTGTTNINTFINTHLTPFFQALITAHEAADPNHYASFQPMLTTVYPSYSNAALTKITGTKVLYAPHYYPNFFNQTSGDYTTTSGYAGIMAQYKADAAYHGVQMIFGEFGAPWGEANDSNTTLQSQAQSGSEAESASQIDQNMLSASRAWWSDDRAATPSTSQYNWAVFEGTSGTGGTERTWLTTPASRPYAAAINGEGPTMSFNFSTNTFSLAYTAAGGGVTDIAIGRARYYPSGFTVTDQSGFTAHYDASAANGLTITAAGTGTATYAWDETAQRLHVTGMAAGAASIQVH